MSPGEETVGFSTSVRINRRDSRASLGTAYGYVTKEWVWLMVDMVVSDPNILLWLLELLWKLLGGSLLSILKMKRSMTKSRKMSRSPISPRGSYLVYPKPTLPADADIKPTRRTHSISTTFGYQPLLLRTPPSSKMRTKKWKILPQAMGLTTTKHLNLHLVSILSLPIQPVYGASTNKESLVAIHYGSQVGDSPVRDVSVLPLETFLPSSRILVYIPLRASNWEKMRAIRSSEHLNLRGGHHLLEDLVLLLRDGLMSDHLWSALLTEWESLRSLSPLGSPYLS